MVSVVLAVTTFASLANLVSSFSTNRRTDDETDKVQYNSIDKWFQLLEALTPETTTIPPSESTDVPTGSVTDPDPLSVVWYLGAFGGLIAFFLVVTFSEWCCASKHLYRRHALTLPYITNYSTESRPPDTPPPPYHLFAPPPYAEVTCCDKTIIPAAPIFIIPVHQPPLPTSTSQEPTVVPSSNNC